VWRTPVGASTLTSFSIAQYIPATISRASYWWGLQMDQIPRRHPCRTQAGSQFRYQDIHAHLQAFRQSSQILSPHFSYVYAKSRLWVSLLVEYLKKTQGH
jgi:hypothetical protein